MSAFGPVEERKPVEEQLRESELRTHAFWDNSPNPIFLKDTELRYLHVNREFERALRVTPAKPRRAGVQRCLRTWLCASNSQR